MAERRKRVGIFNHAKYSEPVLRQISNTLHQKVNNDIQSLLKNNGINSFNNAAGGFKTLLKNDVIDLGKAPVLGDWRQTNQEIENPVSVSLFASPAKTPISKSSTAYNYHQESATKSRPHLLASNSKKKSKFPKEPPIDQIITEVLESFPQITLKNDEPVEYAEMAISLVGELLSKALEEDSTEEQPSSSLTFGAPRRSSKSFSLLSTATEQSRLKNSKDLYKTMCDQSMAWDFSDGNIEKMDVVPNHALVEEDDESPERALDEIDRTQSFFGWGQELKDDDEDGVGVGDVFEFNLFDSQSAGSATNSQQQERFSFSPQDNDDFFF